MAKQIGSEGRRIGGSAKRHYAVPPSRRPVASCRSGQGMTEIVIMMPLFVILACGVLSIGYMCWQGLKVQEAANLAARIQGQERVSGGASTDTILQDNGLDAAGDRLPDDDNIQHLANNPDA